MLTTSVSLPAANPTFSTKSSTLWKSGVIAVLIAALYADVLADLAHDWWTDESLSYGLLIPPMALYIAWLRRRITLQEPVSPDSRGLFLIGAACFTYILGKFGAEFFLPRISFVIPVSYTHLTLPTNREV